MDLQKKREIKGKIKLYNRLGFGAIIIFVVMFVSIFFIRDFFLETWGRFVYIGAMFSMIPFGLYFTSMLQMNESKIRTYKANIRKYRTRVLFQKIITSANQGNIENAIKLYRQIPQGFADNVLFGYLISQCLHSTDAKLNEKGIEKLTSLCNSLDPNEVDLN